MIRPAPFRRGRNKDGIVCSFKEFTRERAVPVCMPDIRLWLPHVAVDRLAQVWLIISSHPTVSVMQNVRDLIPKFVLAVWRMRIDRNERCIATLHRPRTTSQHESRKS